ncbi:hypothetical protein [Nonomuraea sp. NPDC049141]|uniref:hypothetical protein n=1 Tax=Nonomuraea sp. NPDC049141 TaxID=3155500 RepID=UPI0033D9ADD0
MNELVPVAFGLASGLLLGVLTARRRTVVWIVTSVVLGATATFLTGEWRVSWAFLLIDIPIVAGTAVLAYVAARRLTIRWLTAHNRI